MYFVIGAQLLFSCHFIIYFLQARCLYSLVFIEQVTFILVPLLFVHYSILIHDQKVQLLPTNLNNLYVAKRAMYLLWHGAMKFRDYEMHTLKIFWYHQQLRTYRTLGEDAGYDEIMEALETGYGDVTEAETLMSELFSAMQGETESLTEFTSRLKSTNYKLAELDGSNIDNSYELIAPNFFRELRDDRLRRSEVRSFSLCSQLKRMDGMNYVFVPV